jgi:ubiquinone/menaquinone biosynthesis C-methylase UbiE
MANRLLRLEARLRLEAGLALDVLEAELRRADLPVRRAAGDRLVCEWPSVEWSGARPRADVRAAAADGEAVVVVELEGWDELLGSVAGPDEREVGAWLAGRVVAAVLGAASPQAAAIWLTDRLARRPEGMRAQELYASVPEHQPGFDAVLNALRPGPHDVLLEVGCGGGVLLEQTLATGCRAVGVDHSRDMLELAGELNAGAVGAGRLRLVHADAADLGLAACSFTCAAMAHVYFFLSDPVTALGELHRVLAPGGRLAVATLGPEMKGHPQAAPEPLASQGFFWTDEQLAGHAREAGFRDAWVSRRNGRQLLEARA